MSYSNLVKVIRERADALQDNPGIGIHDVELLRVLARLLEGKAVCEAFGAPGDWGYSQPIGKALKEAYAKPIPGVELIGMERTRQIDGEGWTPEHDDKHKRGELAHAAVGYASLGAHQSSHHLTDPASEFEPHPQWPWGKEWWKPSDKPVRNLVKAGALIASEIDRLTRKMVAEKEGK